MRASQQLVSASITDIIADANEKARQVISTIHRQGGEHSELLERKPKTGEHGRTTEEALAKRQCQSGTAASRRPAIHASIETERRVTKGHHSNSVLRHLLDIVKSWKVETGRSLHLLNFGEAHAVR
jgi:hypothetical protein